MSKIELLEPFLEEGIHNTNFFNGRLLSAEDMLREQQANRLQHRQLGQTIGGGVAYGLEVDEIKDPASSSKNPGRIVTVSAGMAINRLGQALYLPEDTDVTLVREKEVMAEDAGLFSPCSKPVTTDLLSGTGIYILVMAPASGYEGQAPASGVSSGDLSARGGCRRRDTVEGVQFRLVRVRLESLPNISAETISDITRCATAIESGTEKPKNLSLLRNLLAHLCFGTAELAGFIRDPFKSSSSFSSYGVVDALRSGKTPALTDCDVPLGLVYWTAAGIQFVDQWSVRRTVAPKPPATTWPPLGSARGLVESEAVYHQFEDHIEWIKAGQVLDESAKAEALGLFRYLPAAGILPVTSSFISDYYSKKAPGTELFFFGKDNGFNPTNFFKNVTCRDPVFIEGARVGHIIRESFMYPPIDTRNQEMLWLYLVRENVQTITGDSSMLPQPYLIFTSGHMSFHGESRFDLSRWDYSSYS